MRILCQVSGGYDSALSLLIAKEKFPEAVIFGIIIDYGQLPFKKEYELAKKFCLRNNVMLKCVEVKNLFSLGAVSGECLDDDSTKLSSIYSPLRNLVMGACTASYAEKISAEIIIVGSKGLNYDASPFSFKDSTLPFYVLLNSLISYASYSKIEILPILMFNRNIKMTKKEVFVALNKRGYSMSDFWNCFNSSEENCGECHNCLEKKEIMKDLLL